MSSSGESGSICSSFEGRRLVAITTADVNAFILKRQKDVMVVGEGDNRRERRYSNGEINRELTTLKRILNLARQNGKLMHVPHVPMLKERNVRTGFFEREQIDRILAHLPSAIRPAVQFAYITEGSLEAPPGFEPGMEVLQISQGGGCC